MSPTRCGGLAALALLLLAGAAAAAQEPERRPASALPLTGPSILRSLALGIDMSPLGRLGGEGQATEGRLPADFAAAVRKAAGQAGRNDEAARAALEATFQVDGAAIYRLDCRACHGADGTGKPPAVASILGPARALSPAQHEEAMRAAGARPRPEMAKELAQQADQALRQRLAEGGKKAKLPYLEVMPAFAHLTPSEIAALEEYLKQLARAPGVARPTLRTPESALRIGEHVVRGTCRICHDATGSGAGHSMMMAGLVPALIGMPEQLSLEAMVHKVRHGWQAMAGLSHQMSRMPIYPYLSDEEVAAAYLYLAYIPPQNAAPPVPAPPSSAPPAPAPPSPAPGPQPR
jgi:mono/diheme cytochrome c family protein